MTFSDGSVACSFSAGGSGLRRGGGDGNEQQTTDIAFGGVSVVCTRFRDFLLPPCYRRGRTKGFGKGSILGREIYEAGNRMEISLAA